MAACFFYKLIDYSREHILALVVISLEDYLELLDDLFNLCLQNRCMGLGLGLWLGLELGLLLILLLLVLVLALLLCLR